MQMNQLNAAVVSKLLTLLPSHLKPIPYLEDKLNIGSDAAYRRMRNEKPFTFEEIVLLSQDLGFSIDSIIGQKEKSQVFFEQVADKDTDPNNSFMLMLQKYYQTIEAYSKAKELELISSRSHIHPIYAIKYPHLFNFLHYRCVHQLKRDTLNLNLSDVKISGEIKDIAKKINDHPISHSKHTYIFDPEIFLSTIKQIQYYYKRKLMTDEEILLIKEDLLMMIDNIKIQVENGKDPEGAIEQYYISAFDIDLNSNYTRYDDNTISAFFVYLVNPMIITNKESCGIHKQWLDSLKKYSALISESNEMLQADFLNRQCDYISNMDKVMY